MLGTAYYSDAAIQVTDEWVKTSDVAYPVSDIKSVKLAKVSVDPVVGMARLMIKGGMLMSLAIGITYLAIVLQGFEVNIAVIILAILALNNLIIGLLIREFRKPQYMYFVQLKGPFGNITAVGSKDKSYGERIVEDIQLAISYNRRLSRKSA